MRLSIRAGRLGSAAVISKIGALDDPSLLAARRWRSSRSTNNHFIKSLRTCRHSNDCRRERTGGPTLPPPPRPARRLAPLDLAAARSRRAKATPRVERYASVWSCSSPRRDRSGGVKRVRIHIVIQLISFISTMRKYSDVIGCVLPRGSVCAEFPAHSLLGELFPCPGKKIPCSVCVGNSCANT